MKTLTSLEMFFGSLVLCLFCSSRARILGNIVLQAFYNKGNLDPNMKAVAKENTVELPTTVDTELLAKVLSNPEMAALISALAKGMEKR